MKKIIAITLVLIMLLSAVSCTQININNNNNGESTTTTTTTTNDNNTDETPDDEGEEGEEGDVVADLSSALAETFAATLQANPEATVEEIINAICADTAIPYSVVSAPIEQGTEFFFGFGNYTITGFESGALCMPMIGSIAFITYVFELPADADAEAFAEQLKSNFDYRWVICDVAADPVVKVVDNMVFFASCPAPDEMPEE